jgi:hypothetical protein
LWWWWVWCGASCAAAAAAQNTCVPNACADCHVVPSCRHKHEKRMPAVQQQTQLRYTDTPHKSCVNTGSLSHSHILLLPDPQLQHSPCKHS